MKILALVLGFMQIAPEIIDEILQVVQHASNPTNVKAALTAAAKVSSTK